MCCLSNVHKMTFYHTRFIKMVRRLSRSLSLSLSAPAAEWERALILQVLRIIQDKPANLSHTNLWEERITFPPCTPSPSLSLSLHTHTHKHLLWCATLCIYTPSTCFPFPPRSSRYSHPIYNPIDTVSCGVLLQESINLQLSATIAIGSPPLPLTPAVDLCVCVSLPGSNFFCVSRKWLTTGQD